MYWRRVWLQPHANRDKLFAIEKKIGAVLAPEVAHGSARGLKPPLRMRQQCNANAGIVAQFLSEHPAVTRVFTPVCPRILSTNWHGSFSAKAQLRHGSV